MGNVPLHPSARRVPLCPEPFHLGELPCGRVGRPTRPASRAANPAAICRMALECVRPSASKRLITPHFSPVAPNGTRLAQVLKGGSPECCFDSLMPGWAGNPTLLRCLQGIATRISGRLDAVQICRHVDSSNRVVWIEDRRTASRSGCALDAEVAGTCADTLVQGPVSQAFELVEGLYHYPVPRCQVWSLEVSLATGQEEGALTDVLDRARTASAAPSVAGMSVYRVLGAPRLLVFAALNDDVVPSDASFLCPRLASAITWRRLLVLWTKGRVLHEPDRREHATPSLYPRSTFWARSMPVLAVAPMSNGS